MQGNDTTPGDEKTSISSLVIRNTLQPSQLPSPDAQLSVVHIHNLKRDGVRAVRKILKDARPSLVELRFWYCRLNEQQWGLILNAVSGVRSRVRTAQTKEQNKILECLKSEFLPPDHAGAESAPVQGHLADDEESEVSDSEVHRLEEEPLILNKLELHGCNLCRRGCVHLMAVLQAATQLEELIVTQCSLDEIDCGILVRVLVSSSRIRRLEISDNGLGDAAMLILSQYLIRHEASALAPLESLNLSTNSIRPTGAIAVGNMLMVPSQLRILNLSGNSLQDEGGLAVASGLAGNGSLQQLDLTDCAIGAAGLAALMNAAHNNMLLQVLLLSKNCCEQSIEPMLVALLQNNRKICRLELAELGRGLMSVDVLAKSNVLRHNCWLHQLDISHNRLQDKGGLVLAKSVGAGWSTSLKILNLNGNRLTTCSGWALVESLGLRNHGLEELHIDENDFGIESQDIVQNIRNVVPHVAYSFVSTTENEVTANCEGFGGCCGMEQAHEHGKPSCAKRNRPILYEHE